MSFNELEKVTEELFNAKKERDETIKSNVNNILKIAGLEYRLSEAEKENNSKSQIIEELKAENGKEGVPKTLLAKIAGLQVILARSESDNKITNDIFRDYTKEINMLNHEIERLMAEESTKSDAAKLKLPMQKPRKPRMNYLK